MKEAKDLRFSPNDCPLSLVNQVVRCKHYLYLKYKNNDTNSINCVIANDSRYSYDIFSDFTLTLRRKPRNSLASCIA